MKYYIQNVPYISEESMLLHLKKGADLYLEYADSDLLVIYKQSKMDSYKFYEISFAKRNFMHLAGIRSKTIKAEKFLDACAKGIVEAKDCTPTHSISNMYSKISVLEQLLDLRHSKCYKIGEKNLVTRVNDFEMAIGNASGVVGYDKRISQKGSKQIDRGCLAIPTTLLTNPITDYSSKPQKIIFILQKAKRDTYYKEIFFEIKQGLLKKEENLFSEELLEKIDKRLFK